MDELIRSLADAPLPRPQWLQEEHWDALVDFHTRLAAAITGEDRPLVVGAAKELVEAVARVTLTAHGKPVGDREEFEKVLGHAHRAIEHHAAANRPPNDPMRQIPEAARKMASQLRELRNRYGTGHGRAVLHDVTDEVAESCVHAALLWSRWALARLQTVLLGAVEPLIASLRNDIFYGGDLTARLEAANVPGLEEDVQRRLGAAVGRRTSRETFVVRIEGVESCHAEPERWPDAYRRGVVEGLFLDEDGRVTDGGAYCTSQVLDHHSDPLGVLVDLRELLRGASWSLEFQQRPTKAVAAMRSQITYLPDAVHEAWLDIVDDLEAQVPLLGTA